MVLAHVNQSQYFHNLKFLGFDSRDLDESILRLMGCINDTTDVGSILTTSYNNASLDERLSYNEMFTRHKLVK
jgi:hypothetical protein